jgi:hypothetical protein
MIIRGGKTSIPPTLFFYLGLVYFCQLHIDLYEYQFSTNSIAGITPFLRQ